MTKKLCTAGVRGPYSYVILNGSDVAVAQIQTDEVNTTTTHMNMDVAEKWVERQLDTLTGQRYETD